MCASSCCEKFIRGMMTRIMLDLDGRWRWSSNADPRVHADYIVCSVCTVR